MVVVRVADGRIGLFLISVREQASVDTLAQYGPPHDKTNKMTVRPAKTQISPGIHPPSLIRVFAVRSVGSYGPKLSSCGQRRL